MADIRYNKGVPPLHPKWHDLLSTVLNNAGIYKPVYISSTYRNAHDQARIMYENIQTKGLSSQKKLYNLQYDLVLNEYETAPSPLNKEGKISLMENKIKNLGIVGGHLNPDTVNQAVFDIPPQPSMDPFADAFAREIVKVTGPEGYISASTPGEGAHHIEFRGNPDVLKKKIFVEPNVPIPHTPRLKPKIADLSNATIILNDRVFEELGDGALQIGDIIFIVDPTQLSFNTQNGYQYFPTLRTQGNPKIPTMSQVKNISINLIFPNEDSINYQLLNLYAMFKRTPFVNIRNKDISAFFKGICFEDEWLSVALESIQIQSVPGFPNTLQASITILPFDYKMISDGFRGLKTLRDVQRQQAILYEDMERELLIAKSESKLYSDPSILDESSKANIALEINKSPDFRVSLPFRAFYQSLIAERKYIKNDLGHLVDTTEGPYSLDNFTPTKEDNKLHEYKAVNNQEPIELVYSYIPDDFRNISKLLSTERTEKQEQLLTQLTTLADSLNTPEDIASALYTGFTTEADLYKLEGSRFALDYDKIVDQQLQKFGITLDNEDEEKPIHNILGYLWRGVLNKTGVSTVLGIGKDLNAFRKGEFSRDPEDPTGIFNGLSFGSNATIYAGMVKITKYLNEGPNTKKKKDAFAAFIEDLRQTFQSELGLIPGKQSILLANGEDGGFTVGRLPIKEDRLQIDNKIDIITGWSLIFANKFVPINIQAFKYPYYQHLGSEDATMSLTITSTSDKDNDFKAKLSLLSERLYDTVKIVTLTAPELITYLDSRLTINASFNHIFNCFGVKKVVFESSNTVNIEGQPNCWNTTVNFTQANFTVAQYHNISQVPTNELVRDEISKLLVRIDKDATGKITVYKYLDAEFKPKNLSLNQIIRFRFLKKYGGRLNDYINAARDGSYKTKRIKIPDIRTPSGFRYEIGEETDLIGAALAKNIQDDISKNSSTIEVVDEVSTNAIKDLIISNPIFKNLLEFLISKMDNLYESKLKFFKTVIYANPSFIETFFKDLNARFGIGGTLALTACLIAFFLIPGTAEIALLGEGIAIIATPIATAATIGTAIGGAELVLGAANAVVRAAGQELKDGIISKLDSIFGAIEDTISSSLAQDFADKVIRDPAVYERLITEAIVGSIALDTINKAKNADNVNCYGDFDLPVMPDITIGPDFYLYNSIVDNGKKNDYINESLKRYAGVGKLCAMMTLVEAKDAVAIYDKLMKRAGNVDEDIKKVINDMILGQKPPTPENIAATKTMLYNQLEAVSLISKGYDRNLLPTKELQDAIAETGEFENLDVRKLNLIKTARISVMLEIFNVYLSLNNFIQEKQTTTLKLIPSPSLLNGFKKEDKKNLTKGQSEINAATSLYDMLTYFLPNANIITQESLLGSNSLLDEKAQKALTSMFNGGMAEVADAAYLSLPGIQNVQNFLVNKIGYYIRLNSFLTTYKPIGGDNALAHLDYSLIPELKFLDYWNFRAVDENKRKIQITKAFSESFDSKKDTTIKLFPTFKLFFIEEDKNFVAHNFDDYYTQNAIQTIEIISNKNSPSTTAVVRLSNVTGALTDRMSLLREKEDIAGYSSTEKSKNLFFGTLDVKPGTQIIIKMGYAPFDNLLTTVFQGRIIEMNNGPVVELICQSFGAQLNHHIASEKFGFLSSVREHGDVASTALDMIPGLEKLGKMSMWGDTGIATFSGKNIRNATGKTGDKLLMSNLLGSLSSMMFGIDNPRDENIYLNYSVSNSIWHHPTFDWVIYDQSVWETLREICLYHRGAVTTIRPYNMNSISTKNDYRDTIVVGDKAGYYKNTDAYGLSTLNIKEVDKALQDWNNVKGSINNKFITVVPFNKRKVNQDLVQASITGKDYLDAVQISSEGLLVYDFLKKELNTLVLVSYLLRNNNITDELKDLEGMLKSITDQYIPNSFDELIYLMVTFAKESSGRNIIPDTYYNEFSPEYQQIKIFDAITKGLRARIGTIEIHPEEYYNVKKQYMNTDDELATLPQYRNIQQHHLITDTSDIISNNISLNANFANVVNVYYTGEPKIKTASLDRLDEDYIQNKLKIWTVKAFGDQRDESSRPLNSYQKNIDTNWYDTVKKTREFYDKYQRVQGTEALKKIHDINEAQSNIPSWNLIPSFGVVAVSLLKQEVSKMYQGTIEIVGNPNIQPFDIIHLQDYTNDMHGAVEVEEVIHTFTPDRGFRTIITPNLITYDRDPIQMQDVQIINQIYDFANADNLARTIGASALGIVSITEGGLLAAGGYAGITAAGAGAGAIAGGIIGATGGVGLAALGLAFLYNGVVGSYIKTNKFLYDQMGNIMGRDCINFTSLLYKGVPFMAGFDGVDYTNLKTIMNHNVANVKNPISRYLAFGDTFLANITTGGDPSQYGILKNLFGGIPVIGDVVNVTPKGTI